MRPTNGTEDSAFNPHGNYKLIANYVKGRKPNKRELKDLKKTHLLNVNNITDIKIFEVTTESNWNYFLVNNKDFYSIPKKPNDCSPSGFGDIQHAKKYILFFYQNKPYNFNLNQ